MCEQDAADPDRDRDVFGVKVPLAKGVAHSLLCLFADRCPYMASSSFFISGPDETAEQRSRTGLLEIEANAAMMAPAVGAPSATVSPLLPAAELPAAVAPPDGMARLL